MFKLVISDDEGKTIIVPLVRDLITVGRQEGNTIRLTERNVSRQHARLLRGPAGYTIEDLDSYNGVLINGGRIDKSMALKDGDRVGIGDYVMALKVEQDVEPARSPQPARNALPAGVPAGPPARLVMISAPAPGAEFSISKPHVRIGRLEELDLCISHRSISREHARVLMREGNFEIEDLQSANGIRVNGSTVKAAPLRSGDVLELGQVRFRFVGPGESYTYDPSEEEPASVMVARTGPTRATMVAVVSGAALLGGALALIDRGEPPAPVLSADAPAPTVQVAAAAPAMAASEVLTRARAMCNEALTGGDAETALRSAHEGLLLVPSDPQLIACQRRADEEARAQRAFDEGMRALTEGKVEDAFFLFEGIPDAHALRARAEIADATQRLAEIRLKRAHGLEATDPAEARRLAASVVQLRGATPGVITEAQHMLGGQQPLRKPSAVAPGGASHPSGALAAASPAPARTVPVVASPTAVDDTPAKTARNCLARGDQRCVIRALEGHTESAQDLALLIETYRALGDTKRAVRHMDTFVTRYPEARQAPQYRQFIAKHESP
jgi:pSer/pThr/pTyr-binding forkhead associated (FHA) protein